MLRRKALAPLDQVGVEGAGQALVAGDQHQQDPFFRPLRQQRICRDAVVARRCGGNVRQITLRSIAAYGRAAITRSCARRSLAAETIFMALVICCVFFTERMRRRMSIKLGMRGYRLVFRDEAGFEFLDRRRQLSLQRVVESLLLANLLEDRRVRILDEAVQFLFELAALLHRQIVEEALGAGVR